ncbi:CU044_5270 family protein [Streptomyces sp. NPDC060194]|uniref:CU044_5270 family protein n=1 Tax=Streptomyces sp. NPDC060194 TaxID=3347069 RepID=UPI00364BFE17
MDETTRVRELRADAPVPDRATLAPGRARLLEAAGASGRRFHLSRRLAVAGAAAAVATALLTTQLVGGPDGRSRAGEVAVEPLPLGDTAALLERAARTVEDDPFTEPRDDQWLYSRTSNGGVVWVPDAEGGLSQPSKEPLRPVEEWAPYVDLAAEQDPSDTDYRSVRERVRFLGALPDDPAEVLNRVREFYPSDSRETRTQHTLRAMGILVGTWPTVPQGQAKLFRALATVPGVDVADRLVTDAAGRRAVAVTWPGQIPNTRAEYLFAPDGFAFLGDRTVVTRDHSVWFTLPSGAKRNEQGHRAGDVTLEHVVLATAVVDAKGARG